MTIYITTDDAAKILKTSTTYIRRLCRKGILTAHKFGRDWQVSRESVIEYKARKSKPGRPKNETTNQN